ncbi:diacylglycerol O-acyltransferase 2-like [Polyodon spathula]|uniref:diacylglycerol O-acyltransferase 2-like n=1 Tax=Polyodon spathula TaxID=7913 RepID=UPI001B7E262B|nr:diacylglycerol O-acyltransferase 2-like [Polyodon spathula]
MSPVPVSMKPWTQELIEKLSVLQGVLTFLGMGIFGSILMVSLLFTRLWILSVLYFTWLFLDWDSPVRKVRGGGRTSKWMRHWRVWKHFSNYYPIKLVKTAELSPERNYVFGCHPHGIMCAGAFSSFSTEGTGFSTMFPGIRPHLATLAGLFKMPIYREYMMCAGMCPVSKPSLKYLLSQNGTGTAVAIVVGGAAESLTCSPGHNSIVIRNRKGFVKLAIEYGADLVPVFSFGENDIFHQVIFEEGSWKRSLQIAFHKYVGFAPCLFKGKGILFKSWGLLPFPKPITTVVGKPIAMPKMVSPPGRVVDHYHQLYMQAILDLFDQHKVACGLPEESQLEIL